MTDSSGRPEFRIVTRRFVTGCSDRLAESTALVDVAVSGHGSGLGSRLVIASPSAEARIRAGIAALHPEEPLLRVGDGDWPDSFLVSDPPDSATDSAVEWLGRWVIAVTIAIQRFARDPVWRGRVVHADSQRLTMAIPWRREPVFNESLELAVRLVHQWAVAGTVGDFSLSDHFGERWERLRDGGIAPYTLSFLQSGAQRGIPFAVLPSCVQLGWGANADRFNMAFSSKTSLMANALAKNKAKTSRTLAIAALPVPSSRVVADVDAAQRAAEEFGWPVVIKPLNRELGSGVVAGIPDAATLRRVFDGTAKLSPGNVMLEKHIDGDDHRMLVVRGKFLMAVRRVPAGVIGDGSRTVAQLVEAVNADPRRGTRRYSLLKKLVFDDEANSCLAEHGTTADSVPAAGQRVPLRRIANISSGGTAQDVTADVHPDNIAMAQRAARVSGLDIAGIDFLTADISRSWRDSGGAICEINSQPGFSPHWLADPGRDIEGEVLDILFAGRSPRIPTAAVTGGAGAAATARMLGAVWRAAGKLTGVCTTAQLRIGDEVVSTDDLAGYRGARIILEDPGVEAAVLQLPPAGLSVSGHPCDRYDVAAVLDAPEGSAEQQAEVLQRAVQAVVINADDPGCLAMRSQAGTSRHILVAEDERGTAIVVHRRHGGEAVFAADRDGERWIVLAEGDSEIRVRRVGEASAAPAGRSGQSSTLFAAALAWGQGIDAAVIRQALGAEETD